MTTEARQDLEIELSVEQRIERELRRLRLDVDRAQMTATFACWYGRRVSEHLGVNTQDVDDQVRRLDPELARALGLEPAPHADPEAQTDPHAAD